ncbi:MAG TPA: NADP-dependent oxidoreductase [Mycobacteriales bacterium]|nr:NADP-dependent oxidoreductase [Mycobacteriales bacterium]
MTLSRQWHLARRPKGWPTADDVRLVDVDLPEPADGEVLVQNHFLSVDPYMRGRMNEAKSYAASYELDQPMYGGAVGQVVASRSPAVPEGTFVRHMAGWRTTAVVPARQVEVVDSGAAPLPAYLGVLGMPGLTAWVGLYDIGAVRPGETVWVSAASGAVGSLVGQLARLAGCRVVGSAGGKEKCDYVVEELGFDACVDHREGDLERRVREHAPGGVDVYFDNVGGDHLRAALELANPFARLVECGMIAAYNEKAPGPDNLFHIVGKKLTVRGFIVSDHADRQPLFVKHVAPLLNDGTIRYQETVVDGVERTFEAFLDLLRGGRHTGKLVVDVRP